MEYGLVKVTDDTVVADAGICYYDPAEETIKEVGSGYILGTDQAAPTVHKLLFVAKNSLVRYLKITAKESPEIIGLFDIKILLGAQAPSLSDFESIPSYNSVIVEESINSYSFVPFYVYIKPLADLNGLQTLPLEVSYDV